MFQKKITHILGFVLISFSLISMAVDDWYLAKNKDGIKVYTRKIEGWGLKEYKAIMEVDATIDQIETVLRDGKNRGKWLHNSYNAQDLKSPSSEIVYTYSMMDAPWPVSDRDNITQWTYQKKDNGDVRIDMVAVPILIPEKSGIVRIKRMQGYWELAQTASGKTKIIQQVVSEAGGSIPDWLANSSIIDTPFQTFVKLKSYLAEKY